MIATNKAIETQQITNFVDDVTPERYQKPVIDEPSSWVSMAHDAKAHSIQDILERPVIVSSGELDSFFTGISVKFPDIILQSSTNVVDKLNYFTYFRANVKIKFVFNATPFMNGKYWMYFAPFEDECNRSNRNHLAGATGYPGIEIDLANGAPVELKIPYCAPLSHYNLLDTHSNMGRLYVDPINTIQSGESPSPSCAYTVFAWFEDIELALPTSKPITVPVLQAQVLVEDEQTTCEPSISGTMQQATDVVKVAENVVSMAQRPSQWVSRAISGTLSMLGWNKPVSLESNSPYVNIPAKGYTNVDGIDLSTKLGAMPDNSLTNSPGLFSTDADEMDMTYVTSKSCIQRHDINWDITQIRSTVIHTTPVCPGACGGTQSDINTTLVAFVSSMFRYWRGGIKYRISVAKTAFHTGRLRITYHPGVFDNLIGAVEQNAYNWVLDLSVSSELEFEIPYVANVPWKEVLVGGYNEVQFQNEKYSTGLLSVTVLNELRRASESVSDNVPVNIWISGASDLSFAIPDFGSYVINPPSVLRAQVYNETEEAISHNEQIRDSTGKMFPMNRMTLTGAEELCMGEKITSLRQLIKRFSITSQGRPYPYQANDGANSFAFPGPIPLGNDQYLFNQLEIDPGYFGDSTIGTTSTSQLVTLPLARNANGSFIESNFEAATHYPPRCPLHYISFVYRFFRGGKRYKIVTPVTNGLTNTNFGWKVASTSGVEPSNYTNAADGFTYDAIRPQDPLYVIRDWSISENGLLERPSVGTFTVTDTTPDFEHYVFPDLTGTCEFEVPYYAQTPISLVGQGTIPSSEGPLIRRAKIVVRRSPEPRGMDKPMYEYYSNQANPVRGVGEKDGGIRNCFGGYFLYEAAADDFTFGYLVGAPKLQRLSNL